MSSSQLYPYWLGQNPQPLPYGSFYSTASQTVTGANVTTPLTYTSTATASQTYFSGSRIYVQATGTYRVIFTVQFDTTSGGQHAVRVWFRKNGVNVPASNSFFTIQNNGENVAACEIILPLLAGDYVEVVMQSTDAGMTASYIVPGGSSPNDYPGAPSIITDINKIA